jgi:hypothetical protein
MECRLAGETEVLGENLPQRHFCPSQNPTLPDPGLNPGRRRGKPATNRLSYGAADTELVVLNLRDALCKLILHSKKAFSLMRFFFCDGHLQLAASGWAEHCVLAAGRSDMA